MLSCAPAYHHHTNIAYAGHKLSNNSETNVGFPPKTPIPSTLIQYSVSGPNNCPYYLRVQLLVRREFFSSKQSSLKLHNSSSNSNPPHPQISPHPTTQDEVCQPLVSYLPSLGCSPPLPSGGTLRLSPSSSPTTTPVLGPTRPSLLMAGATPSVLSGAAVPSHRTAESLPRMRSSMPMAKMPTATSSAPAAPWLSMPRLLTCPSSMDRL